MRLVRVTIAVFLLGLLVFYKVAVFNTRAWDWMYYFWDKGCNVLLWGSIFYLVKVRYRKMIMPVLIFSVIRLVWEIISYWTGISINNILAVAILFTLLIIAILAVFLIEAIWNGQES